MKSPSLRFALVAACATFAPAAFAIGPVGVWMLTDGIDGVDTLIHGSTITNYAQAPNSQTQYALQWDPVFKVFETIGAKAGGLGGVYTENHTLVDYIKNNTSYDGLAVDGTLDTKDHLSYAVMAGRGLYRYSDGFFDGPVTLIYAPLLNNVESVTYDSKTGTLFVGESGRIEQIDVNGNLISWFQPTGLGRVRSLAYDAADDTMWYLGGDGMTAFQTDAAGHNLSQMTVDLGFDLHYGGEIGPAPAAATVPGPAALLPFALGGIAALGRRRRRGPSKA